MLEDKNADTGGSAPGGDDVSDALSSLHLIESVLGDKPDAEAPEGSRPNVELSLGTIIDLLPSEYLVDKVSADKARGDMVPIAVPDLFRQLAEGKGQVTMAVADLIFNVPAALLSGAAFEDRETMVSLPLAQVVAALDPEVLRSKTSGSVKDYDLLEIPDPFVRPDEDDQVAIPGADELPPADEAETETPVAAPATPKPPVPEPPAPPAPVAPEPVPPPEPAPPAPPVPEPEPVVEEETPVSGPVETEPVAPPEPEPVSAPAVPPPPEPAQEAEPDEAEVAEPVETVSSAPGEEPHCDDIEYDEPPGGVNLNVASEAQLRSLNGVSPAVAKMIMEYRDSHGGFKSIFDLYKLPGLGRKTFKKITGMPFSEKRLHRRRKLSRLLGIPAARVTHLPSVAASIADELGSAGCILSDNDGMMLAESGTPDYAESLSAVIPRLMTQVSETLEITGLKGVSAASICVGGEMLTSVVSGDIYVTFIRGDKRLARLQLSFIERVAKELAWLLSHRGYVGR